MELKLNKFWVEAEKFVNLLEQLPESKIWEYFTDGKYGIYYRNMHGVVEHCHYHLGQIVILKIIIVVIFYS